METPAARDDLPTRSPESDDTPTRAEGGVVETFGPGRQVGRFILLREVGRGGMGSVFAAYDDTLDRQVALKVVRPAPYATDGHARLVREARALARLAHPNVVAVYDVGEFAGHVFIAMELIAGETLRAWLRARPRPWREVVEVFVQACRGLAAAHRAGIVHRDFKPANVIVGADGRVRVLDFGLARGAGSILGAAETGTKSAQPGWVHGGQTITGSISGTPAYMAPEQIHGGTFDARTDVFAVCAALYEALFGRRPFGDTLEARLHESAAASPANPPRGEVPAWLCLEVLRGLSRDPERRHSSMDALLAAIDRDPSRRRTRGLTLGLVASGLVTGGYLAAMPAEPRACASLKSDVMAQWVLADRDRVAASLRTAGVSYGVETGDRVVAALDAYAAGWHEIQTAACRAHAEGTHSAELYGLQTTCLDDSEEAFTALVAQLSAANPDIAERASEATLGLPNLERCEDIAALTAAVPPPGDPAVAAEVATLRRQLTGAKVALDLERSAEGLAITAPIVDRAEQLGYRPLLAEALYLLGRLREADDDEEPARLLTRSLWLAERVRDDRQVARSMAHLIRVTLLQRQRAVEALRWRDHAEALIDRLGEASDESAYLRVTLGYTLTKVGELDEAERMLMAVLAAAPAQGIDATNARMARKSLAYLVVTRGRHAEGLTLYREYLDEIETIYGPGHPRSVEPLVRISECELALGQADAALQTAERALTRGEAIHGPDHQRLDLVRVHRTSVLLARGRLREASAGLDQVVAAMRRRKAPPKLLAVPLNNLAAIRSRVDAWPEALAEFREVRALLEAAGEADSLPVASVTVNIAEARIQLGERQTVREDLARAKTLLDTHRVPPEHTSRNYLAVLAAYLDALTDLPARGLASLTEIESRARSNAAEFDTLRPTIDVATITALRRLRRDDEAAARAREALAWIEAMGPESYPDLRARLVTWTRGGAAAKE